MDDQDREDVFLANAALGTDLLTSYAAATGDDPGPPRKPGGCLGIMLAVLAGIVLVKWLCGWRPPPQGGLGVKKGPGILSRDEGIDLKSEAALYWGH
ncbi:MAG: hypothetical protein ABSG86_24015 [Thermoguttaceae bacterium]|jgi:hypothetical protein